MKKRIAVALTTAVMLTMTAASAPAFAGPGGGENSCGAPNPDFADQPLKERTLGTCGVRNNPNFPDKPASPLF